jgi:hypothetical protein
MFENARMLAQEEHKIQSSSVDDGLLLTLQKVGMRSDQGAGRW